MATTIILDQAGVEQAIKNHLGSVVSDLPEDSVVTIKRTVKGAKITVMTPAEAEAIANAPAKAKPGPKPAGTNTAPADPNAPVKRRGRPPKAAPLQIAEKIEEAKAEPEAEVITAGESPTVAEAVETILTEDGPVETVVEAEAGPVETGVAEPFGEKAEEEAAAPRQSLFGALNQPKN